MDHELYKGQLPEEYPLSHTEIRVENPLKDENEGTYAYIGTEENINEGIEERIRTVFPEIDKVTEYANEEDRIVKIVKDRRTTINGKKTGHFFVLY